MLLSNDMSIRFDLGSVGIPSFLKLFGKEELIVNV
jgi:hypothetical protein